MASSVVPAQRTRLGRGLRAFVRGTTGLAGLAAVVAALSGPGHRWGWWHYATGFTLLRWGALTGLVAAGLCLVGSVIAAVARDRRATALAVAGALIGLVVVGVPWAALRHARQVPPIHDITTDIENPPRFVAVLPLRRNAPNSADYGGPALAAQQRQGYPDLAPELFAEPPARAFAVAEAVARQLGWRIVAAAPTEGRLEATDRTFWFGFSDDVVVRITAQGGGSRVDIRSVSRVGRSDVGTNAARIRRFLARLAASGLTRVS